MSALSVYYHLGFFLSAFFCVIAFLSAFLTQEKI